MILFWSRARAEKPGTLPSAVVVVFFLVLGGIAFAPTWPFDGSRLPNGPLGDPLQMVWFLAWTPFALIHGHDPFFTSAIDFPSGANLASNTSVPLLGVIGAPVTLLLNPIATFNVLLRLAPAAGAISIYFVLGRWCRSRFARVVGGLIFGFGPYVATHVRSEGHLNLVFLPIVPLLLGCFDAAFCDERRSAVRVGVLTGVLAACQLLVSPEVLSDAGLVAVTALVVLGITHRDLARRRLRRGAVAVGAAASTFAVLGTWPIVEMLEGRNHLTGPVANPTHLQSFRSDLLEPFLPTARELIAPDGAVRAALASTAPIVRAGGGSEIGAYLGIPLVLAAFAVVIWRRRDSPVVAFALVGAVAFVASLGGRLEIDGHLTAVRLPEAVLEHLPLLKNTVPARFSAFVALGAAGVVALGIDRFITAVRASQAPRHRRLGVLTTAGAVVAILLPIVPSGAFATETVAVSTPRSQAIATNIPLGSVVLSYPYTDPPFTLPMAWQALDGIGYTAIGGYATIPTSRGVGATYAPLLLPADVQEFLSETEAGRARHYPPSGEPSLTDLCGFIARYGIDEAVYAPVRPGDAVVEHLFRDGFGRPRTVAGIEFWTVGRGGRCASG